MSHTESLGLCFRVLISCLKVLPTWSSHLSKAPPLSHHGTGRSGRTLVHILFGFDCLCIASYGYLGTQILPLNLCYRIYITVCILCYCFYYIFQIAFQIVPTVWFQHAAIFGLHTAGVPRKLTNQAWNSPRQAVTTLSLTSCSSLDSAWPGFSPNHFTGTVLVKGLVVKALSSPKSVCLSLYLSLPPSPHLSFQKHLIDWSSPMKCLALLGSSPPLLLSGFLCTHCIMPSLACLFLY